MSTSNASQSSSGNEKKIFEYSQHAANISGKLHKFYEDEQFFDIVLIAGNDCVKIQAHKIVLSALSEYFFELFRSSPKAVEVDLVKFQEINASTLKSMINYMYSGSIKLKLEEIESLLRSAVLLKIKSLVDASCDFLEKNLQTTDGLYWLRLAKELNLKELEEKSLNFIYGHFEEVTKQSEFLLLTEIEVKDLLFNKNSHDNLEEQVFLSLITWIEYEKENREHLLLELLSMIRYQFLSSKFIIKNRNAVCKTVENCQMVYHWLQYHLLPESRTLEEKNFTLSSKSNNNVNSNREGNQLSFIHLNDNNEAEITNYNQTLKTWSLDERSLPLSQNKLRYSTIVINEKLFVVGGSINRQITESVDYLDLKTLKWTDLPPMQFARRNSQLANLNGNLCVFGGFKNYDCTIFIDSMEIFDFSTRKWTDLQPLLKPNKRHKIVDHNGILYIFDFHYGCLQCYDVSANQWSSKKLPIDDSIGEFRVVAVDNFLYGVLGGKLNTENQWTHYDNLTFKRYDLFNDTWCAVGVPSSSYTVVKGVMVLNIENKILFVNGNRYLAQYNLETKGFTNIHAFEFH